MSNGLALMVGGRRLADDSPRGRDIPSDLSFGTSWQGGFKLLDCSLLRDLADADVEQPCDDVSLVADGGARTLFEGTLTRNPRTITRTSAQMNPQALGYSSLLEDHEDARFLGIDRDLGRWSGPTYARRLSLGANPFAASDGSIKDGAISLNLPGRAWSSSAGRPYSSMCYFAGPLSIGRVVGEWSGVGDLGLGSSDGNWIWQIMGTTDRDVAVTTTTSGNLRAVTTSGLWTPFSVSMAASTTHALNMELLYATSPAGAVGAGWEIDWRNVAVMGNEGLPLTGTSAANYGIKFSDAIAYWAKTWAPSLVLGDIVDSGTGIQHLTFPEPTSPADMIAAGNNYHAWAWGVWEGKRLDAHPYGSGRSRTWFVRAGDAGVDLALDGVDVSLLYTDIVVTYSTPTGEMLSVGPAGTIADTFDQRLTLDDPTHPLRLAGRKRVKHFPLGVVADATLATLVGMVMLAQLNAARRSGRITLAGWVTDAFGNRVPSSMVRGGDQCVVVDTGDLSPRRVVETSWKAGTLTATIDNTRQTVEAILAHLGANATGRV